MCTPAAQYLRMSTEHQQYSLENQAAKIHEYACEHGLEIVQSYTDSGRSGVLLKSRNALSSLIADVVSHRAPFKVILVYDVSRWGRFQDTDESAYYEFLCKSAGVPVLYCAEQFNNDTSIPSNIMKTLKRTMAAEYSRELGVKVFAGKVRLARSGFRMGGKPGYGVRRMMLSGTGEPKGLIGTGDMKSYSRDRVVLVPGPRQEQEVIKKIYSLMFEGVRCKKIAERLNSEKVPFLDGRQWHYWSVLEVLRNPKYAGINAWGRSNQRLYGPTQKLPREKWITCEGAFAPIIPPRTYWQMQQLLDNKRIYTDQQMLDALGKVWKIHGKISRTLIRLTKDVPCETQYYRRFGTLENAYRQIGYVQVQREFNGPEHRILSEQLRDRLAGKVERASGDRVQLVRRNLKLRPVLVVDGRIKVDVLVCPYRYTCDQVDRWFFYPHERSEKTHLTIAVLIAQEDRRVHRVYLVPSDIGRHRFRLSDFERLGIRLRKLHEIAQQCWDAKLAGAYRHSSELSV